MAKQWHSILPIRPPIKMSKKSFKYLQVNSEFSVQLNTVQTEKIEFESSTYNKVYCKAMTEIPSTILVGWFPILTEVHTAGAGYGGGGTAALLAGRRICLHSKCRDNRARIINLYFTSGSYVCSCKALVRTLLYATATTIARASAYYRH